MASPQIMFLSLVACNFFVLPLSGQVAVDVRDLDILRRFPGNCSREMFDCGDKCIPKSQFRDCNEDCSNGIDEACWTGSTKCDGCRCVDPKDANRLCLDRSPNKLCTINGHYVCANKQCALRSWVADGRNDCGDWSDENPCLNGNNPCPSNPGVVCHFILPNGFECRCASPSEIYTGDSCVPGATTAATTTTTTPTPTINPPRVRSCQLSQLGDVRTPQPSSLGIIFNTKQSMIPDRGFLVDMLIPTWFNTTVSEPRINSFVMVPYGPTVGAIVLANTMLQMYEAIQQLSGTAHDCRDPAMSALSSAIRSVEPNSVIFVFTDGTASDADAADALLQSVASSAKMVRMNMVVSGACNDSQTTRDTLDKVAAATGGEVFRINKTASDYNSVLQATRRQLRENFTYIDMAQINSRGSLLVPVDVGLDELIISATGSNVDILLNASNSYSYLIDQPNVKTMHFPFPASEYISVTVSAADTASLRVMGVGNPLVTIQLSSNPFLPNAVLSGPVVFGSPMQAVVSSNANSANGGDFPLSTIAVKDIETGAIMYQGPLKMNQTDGDGRQVYYSGKFFPTCRPFIIQVFGTNECNDRFQRMSNGVFQVIAATPLVRGSCGQGQVQCSSGQCINESIVRDFQADCPNGADEARPMDDWHCNNNCSTCSNGAPAPGTPGGAVWCNRPNTFRCANGLCIPDSWQNDGFDDCGDGSDERETPTTRTQTTTRSTQPPASPPPTATGMTPLPSPSRSPPPRSSPPPQRPTITRTITTPTAAIIATTVALAIPSTPTAAAAAITSTPTAAAAITTTTTAAEITSTPTAAAITTTTTAAEITSTPTAAAITTTPTAAAAAEITSTPTAAAITTTTTTAAAAEITSTAAAAATTTTTITGIAAAEAAEITTTDAAATTKTAIIITTTAEITATATTTTAEVTTPATTEAAITTAPAALATTTTTLAIPITTPTRGTTTATTAAETTTRTSTTTPMPPPTVPTIPPSPTLAPPPPVTMVPRIIPTTSQVIPETTAATPSATFNDYASTLQPAPQIGTEEIYRRIFNNTCNQPPGRYFQCTDSSCITVEKFRDCKFHCPDGSDEVEEICSLDGMYPCRAPDCCTRMEDLLNGVQNCPDNSDEEPGYLDECYLGLAHCAPHSYCKNIPDGTYECVCTFGFQGNGTYCDKPHD